MGDDQASTTAVDRKRVAKRGLVLAVRFAWEFATLVIIAEVFFEYRPCLRLVSYIDSVGDAATCLATPILYMHDYGPFFETPNYWSPLLILALAFTLWRAPRDLPSDRSPLSKKPPDLAKRWFRHIRTPVVRIAAKSVAVILIAEFYFSALLCFRYIADLDNVRDVFACTRSPHSYLAPIINSEAYVPFLAAVQHILLLSAATLLLAFMWVRKARDRQSIDTT